MGHIVHFEIHASNPERAAKFYGGVFGWKITRWDGPTEYWLIRCSGGTHVDGAIVGRKGPVPVPGAPINACVCAISVDSLDDALAAVRVAGGAIVAAITEIPGVGRACYGVDTEGNLFGMLESIST
ncbi:MAG TPA: VOC family protein [Verrucomicrobiae bacterium]|nr:VOC family protein [Verrucomicrobiae bacterium]